VKRLIDFAANVYSQTGEDGMIAEVFNRIGEGDRVCVEFGAADGVSCSNTKALRDQGWTALLIEDDTDLWMQIEESDRVQAANFAVTPENLDPFLTEFDYDDVDLMSIDVDGDDYAIWEGMKAKPRVVVIEYNRSIPPHVNLRQVERGDGFGSSALALLNLAWSKGYTLVGMTVSNLIFVGWEDGKHFKGLETHMGELFDYSALTYLVTDFEGRTAAIGEPPWGWSRESYLSEVDGPIRRLPIDAWELFEAYDRRYGPGKFIARENMNIVDQRPEARTEARLESWLVAPLVGIDLRHVPTEEMALLEWIKPFAEAHGYRFRQDPGLITLIKD
jgi:hypothetical protein